MNRKPNTFAEAVAVFREHGGLLRTMEAVRLGRHPRTLYAMRDAGALERLGRGPYRLADPPPLANPDLVAVALRVPDGVLCLLSALAVHDITTQIPHQVCVALKRRAEPPRLEHPPVRVFWFTGKAFTEGIETHPLGGVDVRVYAAATTGGRLLQVPEQARPGCGHRGGEALSAGEARPARRARPLRPGVSRRE